MPARHTDLASLVGSDAVHGMRCPAARTSAAEEAFGGTRLRQPRSAQMDARTSKEGHPPQERTGIIESVRHKIADHPYATTLVAIATGMALIATIAWWLHMRHFESTDDAFIDARVTQVSSQVSGAIVEVPVSDNQFVDAGFVLVKIDDRNYVAALDRANAQVAQGAAGIANVTAQLDAQQALVDQANKQVDQAQG